LRGFKKRQLSIDGPDALGCRADELSDRAQYDRNQRDRNKHFEQREAVAGRQP
jgi:hypothetical protein